MPSGKRKNWVVALFSVADFRRIGNIFFIGSFNIDTNFYADSSVYVESDFAINWLNIAKDDLNWGRDTLKNGYYPQACFIAQQVAEKALKALLYKAGHRYARGHSIVSLAEILKINGEILSAARRLDLYYIAPRYPDALPDSDDPRLHFDERMAEEALALAESILRHVEREFGDAD